MFSIHSISSDRELIFEDRRKEYFFVRLQGSQMSVHTDVWDGMNATLGTFFERLASFPDPWQGEIEWGSYDGEFLISATCSRLGQVTFLVKLAAQPNDVREWEAQALIDTEFGQLTSIAINAKKFFQEI